MEEIFEEKTALFEFKGVIGRKDFFLNRVLISAIALLFTLPYQGWLLTHVETAADMFNPVKTFIMAPILLKIWLLAGFVVLGVLGVSNITRRTRDITNEENSFLSYVFNGIYIFSTICHILPIWMSSVFVVASFIMHLFLFFKKGDITGKYPYDYKKEFNWGAFLGTWIWGLFNKSYKTLWMLLLWFTPWNIHFALYCGLRGNEWAYKNKSCTNVEDFNKSQRNQTTVFAVLLCLVVPVVYFLFMLAFIIIIAFSAAASDGTSTPAKDPVAKIETVMNNLGSLYFEKHEITPLENKFYVSSNDWKDYNFSNKKDIIDLAASMSATEKNKAYKKENPEGYKYFSKMDELPKTKIYSNETGELLGEFVIDENLFSKENVSAVDIFKAGLKAYRFYNPAK